MCLESITVLIHTGISSRHKDMPVSLTSQLLTRGKAALCCTNTELTSKEQFLPRPGIRRRRRWDWTNHFVLKYFSRFSLHNIFSLLEQVIPWATNLPARSWEKPIWNCLNDHVCCVSGVHPNKDMCKPDNYYSQHNQHKLSNIQLVNLVSLKGKKFQF